MTSLHLHKGYMFKMIYMPNIGSNKCYAKGLKDEKLYIEIWNNQKKNNSTNDDQLMKQMNWLCEN
jgi:hypothetical protein